MPRYPNGRVPRSALVELDTGNGRHLSTLRGMVMWYALRSLVWARHGVWLQISPGMNGYRDWDEQGVGRRNACAQGNCNAAAAQGYSSHGGTWVHRVHTGGVWVDAMAFDIGNWYLIGKDAFFAAAHEVGFRPGLIDRAVAGVDEWWHIILFAPYDPPPTLAGWATARPLPKEDTMTVQIRNKETGLIAQVGPDYFAALPSMGDADVVRNVFSTQDERHELTTAQFLAVTRTCGIPDSEVKAGNYWSREYANQQAIAALSVQVAALSSSDG